MTNLRNGLTAGLVSLVLPGLAYAGVNQQIRAENSCPTQGQTVQELIRQELIFEGELVRVKPATESLDQSIARLLELVRSDPRTQKVEYAKRNFVNSYSSVSLDEGGRDQVSYSDSTSKKRTQKVRGLDIYTLEFTEQGPRPEYVVEHSITYFDFGVEGASKDDELRISNYIWWTGNKCHGTMGSGGSIQDQGLSFREGGMFLWSYAHLNEEVGYYDVFVDLPVKAYPAIIRAYTAKLKSDQEGVSSPAKAGEKS